LPGPAVAKYKKIDAQSNEGSNAYAPPAGTPNGNCSNPVAKK